MLAGVLASGALGGCSSGWWHDPPAAVPSPAVDQRPAAYGDPPVTDPYAPGSTAAAEPGVSYPAPRAKPTLAPRVRATPQPDPGGYDAPPKLPQPRYDNVGYAVWSSEAGTVAAAHPRLPPGSFAEVTALDTGRTILVPITATARSRNEIELSGAAATELGLSSGSRGAVRVRAMNASGADLTAFRAGQPAPPRPDTPPVLLNALRHKLSGTPGQSTSPRPIAGASVTPLARPVLRPVPTATARPAPRPSPVAAAKPVPRPTSRATAQSAYYIQVAAVASASQAVAIAQKVGGTISLANGLNRVRFGPLDDLQTAQAARDDVAKRGYGQARIVREP